MDIDTIIKYVRKAFETLIDEYEGVNGFNVDDAYKAENAVINALLPIKVHKMVIDIKKDYAKNKNDQINWKKELVDDFEKHLREENDGILYHHYCIKCGWDWWTDEAFPNRCSRCGCELI